MAKELARLEISQARRSIGVALQGGLGLFLLYIVAMRPGAEMLGSLVLAAMGFAMLWFAWKFWRATDAALVLTTEGLFSTDGRHFCTYADIEKVDRGFFAFRPSSGFVIICKTRKKRGWAPGLWWAFGHHIGIGGATGRPQAKQMADIISVMLTERGAEIKADAEK